MKFKSLNVGEEFEYNGKMFIKFETKTICTFQPHNANEGPAQYGEVNAMNKGGRLPSYYFNDSDEVTPVQTSLFEG